MAAPKAQPIKAQAAAQPVMYCGIEMEIFLQKADRPGDDRRIVAEQQSAQGGDEGQEENVHHAAAVVHRSAPGVGIGDSSRNSTPDEFAAVETFVIIPSIGDT